VTTVFGQVDAAGFEDIREVPGPAERRPCLNDPTGIRYRDGLLYLADAGNHAVREACPAQGSLRTLVGDPAEGRTRWGLLRDAVPGSLGSEYAALAAPTAVMGGERTGPSATRWTFWIPMAAWQTGGRAPAAVPTG